jgi:glycerol-3-phosphate dehydrogenase
MLLLGTTDTLHEGEPEAVEATEADVEQILAEAAVALPDDLLRRDAVRSTFAGLRVLPHGDGSTASARRETLYLRGPSGMLSVAGGKLTTYRRVALRALELLRADLRLRRFERGPAPLPGAIAPEEGARRLAAQVPGLDPALYAHLVHLYGSLAEEVLAPAAADPDLLQPLHQDGPDIAAQALYAHEAEWAYRTEDVLRRRTTLALRGLAGEDVVRRIEGIVTTRGGAGSRAASVPSSPDR